MQTVYVDLLFLVNFSMDFLCIFLTSKILFRKTSLIRAAIASAMGGAYSVAAIFLPSNHQVIGILSSVLCCILMCLTVFWNKGNSLKSIVIVCVTYILSSVLLGGIMTAAFNLLNNSGFDLRGGESNDIPPWLFILAGIASISAACMGGKFLRHTASQKSAVITATIDKKTNTFKAMCDSGNLLRDSISGRPVIVVDKSMAKDFFDTNVSLDTANTDRLNNELKRKIAIIPYSTASGNKTMLAFRPKKLIIESCGSTHESDAFIGFADVKCVNSDCMALIPPDLI